MSRGKVILNEMRKLAIITHEYYPVLCGGTVFADKISQAFSAMGYEVEILTTGIGSGFIKSETNDKFKVKRFYTGRKSWHDAKFSEHLRFLLFGFPQMLLYLMRERTDLLFCIFTIPSGLIGVILSKLLRIPSVVFVDAADVPGIQSAMKGITNRLKPVFQYVTNHSAAVTILDGLQDVAQPLIRNSITAVIPNGTSIPLHSAKPGTSRNTTIELLSIGRLVLRKGFKEIIQALSLVRKKTANFHLTIVGYGTREEEIRQLLEENNLSEHITMTGRIEYEKLVEYYLGADCYLFYGDREGSSLAMIEAVSYGLPVIASDHPGNTTYVKNGYNGILVEYKNIEKLSEAVMEIINHRDRLSLWGKNSMEIANYYTWDKIAAQYDRVFATALEKDMSEGQDEWLPYPRYLLRKNLIRKIFRNENVQGKKCLEIGYGAGDMLLLYAELGFEAYGFDFSELARTNASKRIAGYDRLKERITLYEKESDLQRNKYDYIIALEVLEHIKDDAGALKRWLELLNDGGKIILSVPAHKSKWGDSDVAVGHYRRYEKKELINLCSGNNIDVRLIWCWGYPLTILLDPVLNASKRAEVKDLGKADREDLSKKSGVERKKNILYKFLFNDFFLFPFYLLGRLFLNTDIGSGYIVFGEVKRENQSGGRLAVLQTFLAGCKQSKNSR